MSHVLKKLSYLLPFSLSVFLSACVSLLPEPGKAPKRIFLEPTIPPTSSPKNNNQTLAVTRPTTTHMLDSDRIQIRNLKGDIPVVDYIASVEWQDHLPLIIQRHLAKTAKQSNKFKAVGFVEDSFNPDVILESDIQNFDIVVSNEKMFAEVTLSIKLLHAKSREVIWQKTLTSNTPIAKHKLVDFIDGLTKVYSGILHQVAKEFS